MSASEPNRALTVRFDRDLERLEYGEWTAIASAYQRAFAGEPWFEVGSCAAGAELAVPADSPCNGMGGKSPLQVNEECSYCLQRVTLEAFPLPSLLNLLERKLTGIFPNARSGYDLAGETELGSRPRDLKVDETDRFRILYREIDRSRDVLLLCAMFWAAMPGELIEVAYEGSTKALRDYLSSLLPSGRRVLYLDEIFADLGKRAKGNLANFAEMCMAAARMADTDVITFRTKSDQLRLKAQREFPGASAYLPSDVGLDDDRWFVVIPLDTTGSGFRGNESDDGFPEWLPAGRRAEANLIEGFRKRCELHGFGPIETPAVESLSVLRGSVGVDQQIFTVSRPIEDAPKNNVSLGLHFDLTVPLARYVNEHHASLSFPFRRYQDQKVWRGERVGDGRFREFSQFDFDVVGDGALPDAYDVEILLLANDLLSAVDVSVEFHISDTGVFRSLLSEVHVGRHRGILKNITKCAMTGRDHLRTHLEEMGISSHVRGVILNLLDEPYSLAAAGEAVKGFTEAEVAVSRLGRTLDELSLLRAGPISVTPDMSLVRDLSYYRGFVFEAFVPERAEWGSVCSGGRYDDVLGTGDRLMPGVGASIGTTRLFSLLQAEGLGMDYGQSPTQVAIVVDDWTRHSRDAHRIAADLRNHGTCVELVYGGSSLADLVGGAFRRGTTHVVRFVDDEVLVLDRSRKELRTSVEGATEQLTP